MHTISLSLDFCDSRLFCTAVMMRDKLVKASFPASLGKALAVSTHHRSRSQDLLCCKLKLETYQLNMCLWRSTCCDRRKEQRNRKSSSSTLLGINFHTSTNIHVYHNSDCSTSQQEHDGGSTCISYYTVRLFLFGS